MSLLNDVLRDLQTRGVFGVPPLTGLEPVADASTQHRRRTLLLSALAALSIASAIVLWRPVADQAWVLSFARIMADATSQPQSVSQTDAKTSPQAEPALAATGDDLRKLFAFDSSTTSSPAPRDDYVADPSADSPAAVESPAVVESPAAVESQPAVESQAAAASPVTVESPAALEPAATTTILRRKSGTEATAATVARGLKAMGGNDLRTAEHLFREALVADSGDAATWSYLYSVLVRASQPAAAERALQRGMASARQPAALAKLYARMLLDRAEKDAALSILQAHRPRAAADAEYDAFLAALLQQLGHYGEAGEIYRTLLTVEPGSGSGWIGLAMSHDSLGNRADALSAFERALGTGSLKTPLARYARRRSAELKSYD